MYTDDVGEYQPISDGAVMGILAAVLVRWGGGGTTTRLVFKIGGGELRRDIHNKKEALTET